jgi:RNA polymerase sigma-70 factor (ECF subfamily)
VEKGIDDAWADGAQTQVPRRLTPSEGTGDLPMNEQAAPLHASRDARRAGEFWSPDGNGRRSSEERRPMNGATVDPQLRDALLGAVPSLRAFAFSLTYDADRADDLVQETLMRAWAAIDRFERGTNFNAWLFTILRNLFYSVHRKRRREVEDPDGAYAGRLRTAPEQTAKLEFKDFQNALNRLTSDQREVLVLVGAEGFSYEEAAHICGVAVGTIKSRVNRARSRLSQLLGIEDEEELGPDRVMKAALRTD